MNDPEPTSQFASMEAILDSVAQPVWVVDHDGFVVFVNPAGLAALGYDELSELRGRFGHDAIHYKHRDGSPYPAEDCPMTKVRGTGESVQMDEDWFVRRDGSMFPVSYTSTPIDMPDGPGVVVAFKDIEEQREAEQALREREAILATVGQPVWVTDQAGRFHYANPAALAALGYDGALRARGPARPRPVHYKYPDGTPFPEDDCPLVQARRAGETLQDTDDWLVRKDGSIVRVTYSSAPFDLPDGLRLGHRVQRRRGAAPRRAGGARARRRRGARGRAARRAAAHHRGRGRGARAARARPARRRAAAVRQRPAAAAAGRAQGVVGSGPGARAARSRRSSWPAAASTSCAASPPGSIPRSSPTAASGRRCSRSPPGCRSSVSVVRTPDVRLPAPGRGQRLLLRLGGADQRGQARAGRARRP